MVSCLFKIETKIKQMQVNYKAICEDWKVICLT